MYGMYVATIVTGFWKTDHIVTREINRISMFKYRLNLKTEGSTEFITRRLWAVAPERSEGATKGLRVINYVDHVGFEV